MELVYPFFCRVIHDYIITCASERKWATYNTCVNKSSCYVDLMDIHRSSTRVCCFADTSRAP